MYPMGYNSLKRDENGNLQVGENNMNIYDTSKETFSSVLAEAVTFVPGVKIEETLDEKKNVVGRKLVAI